MKIRRGGNYLKRSAAADFRENDDKEKIRAFYEFITFHCSLFTIPLKQPFPAHSINRSLIILTLFKQNAEIRYIALSKVLCLEIGIRFQSS